MISAGDLQALLAWRAPEGRSILSVYLDRKAAEGIWNTADLQRLVKDLVKDLEFALDEDLRSELVSASRKILDGLTRERWGGRSIAAFAGSDGGDGFWARGLRVPVPPQARWEPAPHVLPLLEAIEEYERYAVVSIDRTRARLFTIFLGEIEEERDAFNPEPIRHVASTGADQALTMNLQRRAEEHARAHWKRVAATLDAIERQRHFDRLILGGPTESSHGLRDLLPKRLRNRVEAIVSLPVEAGEAEVLARTLEIEREAERARQLESVRELQTASAKHNRAVAGLEPTLEALREGRVWRLLYVEGLRLSGRRCENCGTLFAEGPERCGYCGGASRPVPDLVEEMGERTRESGGRIEPVTNAAADFLRGFGGIGAFLRF